MEVTVTLGWWLLPHICTGGHGCVPPKPYCIECSHAWFNGKAEVNGEKYAWAFNSWYGPEFTEKGVGTVVPEEDEEIWDAFEKWLRRLRSNYINTVGQNITYTIGIGNLPFPIVSR